MNSARKHERLLIVLIVLAFVTAILAVQFIANRANERDARNAVTACERGNVIRNYLAFDNGERITRIETRLSSEVDPAAKGEIAELQSELTRRLEQRQVLVPFDCETLR
jgi:Flp pilus assembly protein CpaB